MRSAVLTAVTAALLLTACAREPDEPGGVTADEAQQLNDAAAMLDANSMDANALATGAGKAE